MVVLFFLSFSHHDATRKHIFVAFSKYRCKYHKGTLMVVFSYCLLVIVSPATENVLKHSRQIRLCINYPCC